MCGSNVKYGKVALALCFIFGGEAAPLSKDLTEGVGSSFLSVASADVVSRSTARKKLQREDLLKEAVGMVRRPRKGASNNNQLLRIAAAGQSGADGRDQHIGNSRSGSGLKKRRRGNHFFLHEIVEFVPMASEIVKLAWVRWFGYRSMGQNQVL